MKASIMKSTLAGVLLLTAGSVFSEAAKQPDPMQEMQKTMQQIMAMQQMGGAKNQ